MFGCQVLFRIQSVYSWLIAVFGTALQRRGLVILFHRNPQDDDDEDQDEVTAPKLQDFCVQFQDVSAVLCLIFLFKSMWSQLDFRSRDLHGV